VTLTAFILHFCQLVSQCVLAYCWNFFWILSLGCLHQGSIFTILERFFPRRSVLCSLAYLALILWGMHCYSPDHDLSLYHIGWVDWSLLQHCVVKILLLVFSSLFALLFVFLFPNTVDWFCMFIFWTSLRFLWRVVKY